MLRWLTTEEIMTLYRRPRGTVYRLASVHRWRRTDDGRKPVLYDADDVSETFDRLAAG